MKLNEFHIGIWEGPRLFAVENDTEMEKRFLEMKENGIDTMFLFAELQNDTWLNRTINMAERLQINLIVDTSFCWRDENKRKEIVNKTKTYNSVIGYNIMDEPPASFIPELSAVCKWYKETVPNKLVFVNLNPNYAPHTYLPEGNTRREKYRAYLETFLMNVKVDMLSFDYYPYVGDKTAENKMMVGMLENLADTYLFSKKYNIPLSGFLQTSRWGHFDDNFDRSSEWHGTRIPTEEELRRIGKLHMIFNTCMLTDFLYWSRSGTRSDQRMPGVFDGIIWEDGTRSPLYEITKRIHGELRDEYDSIKGYVLSGIVGNNLTVEEMDAVGELLIDNKYVSFEKNEKAIAGVFKNGDDFKVIKTSLD